VQGKEKFKSLLFETAKPKPKKGCFTTYINHQDEIFKAVNRIHKIKKEAPHH